jgi:dTDP-4-dehydrorhamnose reductase
LNKQFVEFRPDVVIHAAAERRPDVVHKQPEKARALNVDATRNMAQKCEEFGAWLISLSSDYIFDGSQPPYAVDAEAKPLSAYGEQKLEGERICRDTCANCTVLRVPLLYGPMEYVKESGVTATYAELQKGVQKADHTQKRYPTYTVDVANIFGKMLDVHFAGNSLCGIFHWQADECLTKYDMMTEVARICHMNASQIVKSLDIPKFPGPKDSRLDCSKLVEALNIDPKDYRTRFSDALRYCFRTLPKEELARDIHTKLEPALRGLYSQDDVTKDLSGMDVAMSDARVQRLINKSGDITVSDYKMLVGTLTASL